MQAKNKILLDASAVLALLKQEKGHTVVEEILAKSCCSSVNVSEVISVLIRSGVPAIKIDQVLDDSIPEIIPFTREEAKLAGIIIQHTKDLGLSLGDRACIATSIHHKIPVYTADSSWSKLKLDDLTVKLIR